MIANLLRLLPPEPAHSLAIRALQVGLGPSRAAPDPRLSTQLWGQTFASPLGLAAGFDKQGQVMSPMLNLGFGFVEIGTVTPLPQPGNPRPRVFRASKQRAILNRYGFNSDGHDRVLARLKRWRKNHPTAPLGVNLGLNRDTADPLAAYQAGIRTFETVATYLVVNLSSPNTPGLRAQQTQGLRDLIVGLQAAQRRSLPLLLKVAPDLSDLEIQQIADTSRATKLDGLIVSNTTLARAQGLPSTWTMAAGGVSGAPLTARAHRTLRLFAQALEGRVPLIGVGGLMSGADAVARLQAGADLLQVYTGLVYRGFSLVDDIHRAILAAMDCCHVASPAGLKGRSL